MLKIPRRRDQQKNTFCTDWLRKPSPDLLWVLLVFDTKPQNGSDTCSIQFFGIQMV